MKYRAVLAATLIFGAASQAQADNGLRAEAHIGWDHPSVHLSATNGLDSIEGTAGDDGLLYGGEIGFDKRLQNFDLGIYGGIDGASTKECLSDPGIGNACVKAGRNWNVGVRAGYFLSDGLLAYVRGGYSNGSVKLDYRDAVNAANDIAWSGNMDGYHVGAGVQLDLGSNVYAKLEYVHTNYEDYEFRDAALGIGAATGVDRDNIVYGFGFRF